MGTSFLFFFLSISSFLIHTRKFKKVFSARDDSEIFRFFPVNAVTASDNYPVTDYRPSTFVTILVAERFALQRY